MNFRISLYLSLLMATFWPYAAQGYDILVIKSANIVPFNESIRGLQQELGRTKIAGDSIAPFKLHQLTSRSQPVTTANINTAIRRTHASIIVTIGTNALKKVLKTKTTLPIVYLMVPNPKPLIQQYEHITGVALIIPPQEILATIQKHFPGVTRVGVLYDPHNSPVFNRPLKNKTGTIKVIAYPVDRQQQVAEAILQLAKKVDALWMIPDRTIVTSANVEVFVKASLEKRIPLVTFANKYLKSGATLAITRSPLMMGTEAGQIVSRILAGNKVTALPIIKQPPQSRLNPSIRDLIFPLQKPQGDTP